MLLRRPEMGHYGAAASSRKTTLVDRHRVGGRMVAVDSPVSPKLQFPCRVLRRAEPGELALDTVLVVRVQKIWNDLGTWKGDLVVIGTSGRVTFSPSRLIQ